MEDESTLVFFFSLSPRLERGSLASRGQIFACFVFSSFFQNRLLHFLELVLDARVLFVLVLKLRLRLVVDHPALSSRMRFAESLSGRTLNLNRNSSTQEGFKLLDELGIHYHAAASRQAQRRAPGSCRARAHSGDRFFSFLFFCSVHAPLLFDARLIAQETWPFRWAFACAATDLTKSIHCDKMITAKTKGRIFLALPRNGRSFKLRIVVR